MTHPIASCIDILIFIASMMYGYKQGINYRKRLDEERRRRDDKDRRDREEATRMEEKRKVGEEEENKRRDEIRLADQERMDRYRILPVNIKYIWHTSRSLYELSVVKFRLNSWGLWNIMKTRGSCYVRIQKCKDIF